MLRRRLDRWQARISCGEAVALHGSPFEHLAACDERRIVQHAEKAMCQPILTLAHIDAPRSAGGRQDYFSEGDYWWPNPVDPEGPYLRRDGYSNPDNFVAHRNALIRFCRLMPALTMAWLQTRDTRYLKQALAHVRAWLIDPQTSMHPHMQFAQAIRGRTQGRWVGIVDAVHLVEVLCAISELERHEAIETAQLEALRRWVRAYLDWLTHSKNGIGAREASNNHGTSWCFQVAGMARFVGDEALLEEVRRRYTRRLLPMQLRNDGGFVAELARTRPYNYSLFNLELMAGICQLASTPDENLFACATSDGLSVRSAIEFMYPYLCDKAVWPFAQDVVYFDRLPFRASCLLFGGLAWGEARLLALWEQLNTDVDCNEVQRNCPIRQPWLWLQGDGPWPGAQASGCESAADVR